MFTPTTPVLNDLTGTLEVDWVGLRGDSLYFTVLKAGLADWDSVVWTAQTRVLATDTDIVKAFTVTNNSDSENVSVYFLLQTDDITDAKLVYDVQFVNGDITETVMAGSIKIKADVTRA